MLQNEEEPNPTTWRDNWFIVNWFVAIPILRSALKPSVAEGVDTFLGDTFMLGMGTLFMVEDVFNQHMDDAPEIKAGKSLATMVTGMGTGMALYNTGKSAVKYGASFFYDDSQTTLEEREPLLPTSHASPSLSGGIN